MLDIIILVKKTEQNKTKQNKNKNKNKTKQKQKQKPKQNKKTRNYGCFSGPETTSRRQVTCAHRSGVQKRAQLEKTMFLINHVRKF